MSQYVITAGMTAKLRFQLLDGGAPIDLTNATVELLLSDRRATNVASPGTVAILDEVNGVVQLTPATSTVFLSPMSPYLARWKITDSAGLISYCPTGPRDVWNVIGA